MIADNRELVVKINGTDVSQGCRVHLFGESALSLYPYLWVVSICNLSDAGYNKIRVGGSLSVVSGNSELAGGIVRDVSQKLIRRVSWTLIGFSLGLELWEKAVSLSVAAGKTAAEVVSELLTAADVGVRMLNQPNNPKVFFRGWSFSDSASAAIERVLLSAGGCRACMVPSGIVVADPDYPAPIQANLSEADLVDKPVFTATYALLRTKLAWWPIGRRLQLSYQNKTITGLITKRMLDADTELGPWESEVLVELENSGGLQ